MLTATAKITDCQLEPDDETKFVVTVTNSSPVATASDIVVVPTLHCGKAKGIELTPAKVNFGSIGPKGSATQQLDISTKAATPNRYRVLLNLKYSCEIPKQECSQQYFDVVKD